MAIVSAVSLKAEESDAIRISRNLVSRHMPFGTVMDPVLDGSDRVTGYSRCGDSAIWTGHYLAAESFRYNVTRSEEALANIRKALDGLWILVEVTGSNLLARCAIPSDAPFRDGILSEEAHHGSFNGTVNGKPYVWVGNTSRDQYSGVFFGLAVAYDLVDDAGLKSSFKDLVFRLLDRLLRDNWAVVMPDGSVSTVFWGRADQQLALLQIGGHVVPERYDATYQSYRFWYASSVPQPLWIETLDTHSSYFKFNLAAINLYNLIRLEDTSYYEWWYRRAYDSFREATAGHGNAHFNMIDRALGQPDAVRDAETRALLEVWLRRPARDEWLDWRGKYRSCGEDWACQAIPLEERIRTDFLWQRSPFLLYGGGSGKIENAGIDYLLPYWMGRYYGVF